MRRNIDFWLILLAAFLLQVIAFDPNVNPYDEGIILAGAQSVFEGKLPYRDFWTMYGPGQFYLTSWLFSLFGPSDLVVRGIGLLAKSLIVALGFLAIRKTAGWAFAFAGAVVVLGILIGQRQDAFPVFPATALALGALLLLDEGRRGRASRLVAAGVLTSLAACFRHDLGAYCAAASVLALCVDGWLGVKGADSLPRGRRVMGNVSRYVLGILLVGLPVAAFFLVQVPFPDLYENLVYIPSVIYPGVRALPWPGLDIAKALFSRSQQVVLLAVYVPFLVCTAALLLEIRSRSRAGGADSFLVSVIALTGLLFTLKGLVRVSNIHMVQSLVLSAIVLPSMLLGAARQNWRGRLLAAVALAPAAGLLILLCWPGLRAVGSGAGGLSGADGSLIARCVEPRLPRLRCADADPRYIEAAKFVAEHSGAADRIYVGAGRHDKLFINPVAFYFFAARTPATKWYELHPGVQTQRRVQEAMIAEMRAAPPRLIVLDSRWDGVQERNLSRESSGEFALDEYISGNFSEVARFGPVRVLAPR